MHVRGSIGHVGILKVHVRAEESHVETTKLHEENTGNLKRPPINLYRQVDGRPFLMPSNIIKQFRAEDRKLAIRITLFQVFDFIC